MSRQNTVLTPEDLDRLTQAVNGVLANLTIIENLSKGHTAEYSKVSMTAPDTPMPPKAAMRICSVCGRRFPDGKDLSGSINPDFPLRGFKNYSQVEGSYRYAYCGISCNERLSAAMTARASDVDQHPYHKPGEVIRS